MQPLLTTADAAKLLGLSTSSLRRLVLLGRIPAIRPTGDRLYRFDPEDIRRHVERHRVELRTTR